MDLRSRPASSQRESVVLDSQREELPAAHHTVLARDELPQTAPHRRVDTSRRSPSSTVHSTLGDGGGEGHGTGRAALGVDSPPTLSRPMSNDFTTDQKEREASGAHAYGRYLEEFEEGAVYKHWPAKTVTEADDHLFCLITMNHHPLHINDVYAGKSQQGRNVVVGPLVYSLALGMSVSDVSGKAIANLATEELSHPAPVFHGDTLFVESEVLEKRESRSKPDRGTVKVHTRVFNQDGTLVAEFKRLVLVPGRTPAEPARAREGLGLGARRAGSLAAFPRPLCRSRPKQTTKEPPQWPWR